VHGATLLHNAEPVPYEFLNELNEMKMDFTMVLHIPPVVKGMRSTEQPVLPKASPNEEIE